MKIVYAALIYFALHWLLYATGKKNPFRLPMLAILNTATVGAVYYWGLDKGAIYFALYVAFVGISFALTDPRLLVRKSKLHFIPLFFPILVLLAFKSFHWVAFIGISYLSFRLSRLVMEVRDGLTPRPTLSEYFAFAFFPPLMVVGPISSFRLYKASLFAFDPKQTPLWTSAQRIAIGALKFLVITGLLLPLIPWVMVKDGYLHGRLDFVVMTIAYYFYLYCNFSGYIDMVIGFSGLLGVRLQENFDAPYFARNIQDFWRRWHITLANFMRDVAFTPYVRWLSKKTKGKHYNHIVASGILITFLLTGLWHGFTMSFLVYGLFHAFGLVVHFYYSVYLRKALGPRIEAYNKNLPIRIVTTLITFFYVAMSFHIFANEWPRLGSLFRTICWNCG